MKQTRRYALEAFHAALAAVNPTDAVVRALRRTKARRVFVLGAGKAAMAMAVGAERALGDRIVAGWVNVPEGIKSACTRIHAHACGHPIPDRRGVLGSSRILQLARSAQAGDLVVCLISGGASALMPAPATGLTLAKKQSVTHLLLRRGANIHELNTVRKHLSAIKGGHLAVAAYPAQVLSLVLSDVVGDDLSVIGSGPTVPDPSSVHDAAAVLRKYDIAPLPLHDTPSPTHPVFKQSENRIIGSNRLALDAAARAVRQRGYRPIILSSTIEGETKDVAKVHAAIAREAVTRGSDKVCFLSGGETTVTVRGKGRGGRNQEFALACAIELAGLPVTTLSVGTDGIDGPTDAAGAFSDGTTLQRDRNASKYLANNDSYTYFQRLEDLVTTGPTGTNVMDLRMLFIDRRA